MKVRISTGNSKMGSIPSVSLPSGITCPQNSPCRTKCYAKKLERRRRNVRNAYAENYKLLLEDPCTYWREVEASVMTSRFFRFHVSGDIPLHQDYLMHMMDIASRNPHCQILCFTKRYELVNGYLRAGVSIPENLHLIFSVWKDFPMDNPFGLPEAHVRYKDGTTTASANAKECGGNCTECAITNGGCWTLKHGEQIVFNEH